MSPHAHAPIALQSPAGATLTVVHGKVHTALVLSTGRGIRPSKSSVALSEIGRDQLLTALLDWRYIHDDLPDDDVRVILATEREADLHGEPLYGSLADGLWYNDEGGLIEGVYAWAHIPALPPMKKGGAS